MASTERAPLQRDTIIASTRALIAEDGLDQLTLRRLAGHLGVTAPALYGHFEDKGDLLRTLAEVEFSRLQARFDAIEATDPLERIRADMLALLERVKPGAEVGGAAH